MELDYSRFTEKSRAAITRANQLTRSCQYAQVMPQVLMVALIQEGRDMAFYLLQEMGVDRNEFCQVISDSMQDLPHNADASFSISNNVQQVLKNAITIAERCGKSTSALEHIFWSLVTTPGPVKDISIRFGINAQKAQEAVVSFNNGYLDHSENRQERDYSQLRDLNKYAQDMSSLAESGKIEPVIGRDDEIRHVLQILSRKTKNNPLLVGAPGTGKTAIIEGLAHRLLRGDVPQELADLRIFSLDLTSLVAGTSQHGEFEERLKGVIRDAKTDPNIVLFIDEMHLLVAAGGAMNAANILKPELARGEIKVIGATTTEECTKFIESDRAFERRFRKILVEEPNTDTSITILRGIKPRFEAFHRIKIQDEAIVAAVKLSQRYISDRYLPDKAIDLIDEAASKMRIERSSVPAELDALSALIRSKEMERESLRQDEEEHDLSGLDADIANLREKENELNAKWQNERARIELLQQKKDEIERTKVNYDVYERSGQYENAVSLRNRMDALESEISSLYEEINESSSPLLKTSLDEDDIRLVIQSWTGIPVSKLNEDESEKLLHLEETLKESVVGQGLAVAAVSKVIRRNRMGFGDAGRPIGSFLFLGTTGVGKTELAKTLAGYLFNSREMIVRIDMSEYQQEFSVSRLFGAPPGYVGYDQGGQLTEAVRHKPYSVILLDEIEKAHPKVFETLLQVLDDGRMTDGHGRVVDFKNTIIIMTSNLGARAISQHLISNSITHESIDSAKEQVLHQMKEKVSPEFINRIDDIIMFMPLGIREIAKIVCLQLSQLSVKLRSSGTDIIFDESAVALLTKKGFVPEYGARPVKRAINDCIVNELTMKILAGEIERNLRIMVSTAGDQFVFNNLPQQ